MTSSRMFIQIGNHFFNVNDIIEVYTATREAYDEKWDRLENVDTIRMVTRALTSDGVASSSGWEQYDINSPESNALISWLKDNTQVLLPLEPAPQSAVQESLDIEKLLFEKDAQIAQLDHELIEARDYLRSVEDQDTRIQHLLSVIEQMKQN